MSGCGCESGPACTTAPIGSKRAPANGRLAGFAGNLLALFGGALGMVVLLAVLREWFGVLGALTDDVPWPVWLVAVLVAGYLIFRAVLRAAFKFRVTSHGRGGQWRRHRGGAHRAAARRLAPRAGGAPRGAADHGAVRFNLGFTAIYNLTGLALASLGILPPVLAAAAQSLPDFGILSNSARLLRQQSRVPSEGSGSHALSRVDVSRSAAERRFVTARLRLQEVPDQAGG